MKKILSLVLLLIPSVLVLSCKPEDKKGGDEGSAAAQLSVVIKDAQQVYEVPEHQSVSLSLSVVPSPVSPEGYTITLATKQALVATYNAKNGTSYEMLPFEAFSLVSTQVMLPRYSTQSTSVVLRLKGEGCDPEKTYVLPVAIDGVQGGTNFQAPDDKAAYIVFKLLESEGDGEGTQSSPYEIKDVESFVKMGNMLQDNATTYFKLEADLDFKDVVFTDSEGNNPWIPVNYAVDKDAKAEAVNRRIVFDGSGHTISNFKAGGPLFGIVCGGIKNLTVDGAEIESDNDDAAVVVGEAGTEGNPNDFTIENVIVKNATVSNDYKRSGGLIAYMYDGVVKNCEAACNVTAQQQGGGLIGRAEAGTITDCSASGNVTIAAYLGGGLIGYADKVTVTNCHASGNVLSEAGNYVRGGGLIGQIDGDSTIEKCYATGNVEGQGHMAGGLVGVVGADNIIVNISKCYATGNVTLPTENGNWAHGGGILGTLAAKGVENAPTVNIDNCYSTGAITVRRYSGGFIGSIYAKPGKINVTNSYTTADLSGILMKTHCGIFIGLADAMAAGSAITCKGFVAWDVTGIGFSFNDVVSVDGNYWGTEGTVSQQAAALGWSTDIWDLSGSLPILK